MTADASSGGNSNAVPARPADDDYDLLTYGEATTRLLTEIRNYESLVGELTESGAAPSEIAAAGERLAALRETAQRHSRQRLTGENFIAFFGRDPRRDR